MYKYIKYKGVIPNTKVDNLTRKGKCSLYIIIIAIILLLGNHLCSDILDAIDLFLYGAASKFEIQITSNLTTATDIEMLYTYSKIKEKYIWQLHPWIIRKNLLQWLELKEATVKLAFPNHVYIRVTKRKPYAVWWNYKDFFLVDNEGVVISDKVTNQDKKDYMIVIGHNALKHLHEMVNVLKKYSKQSGKVISLRFVEERRWDMILSNGIVVKLSEKQPHEAMLLLDRIMHIATMRPFINDNCIIDMRLMPDRIFIMQQK